MKTSTLSMAMLYVATAMILAFAMPATASNEHQIDTDRTLVTIILKHQQDKNLSELQAKMDENRFWQSFPPDDMEIDSWYVVMGLGQVITLRVHPRDIRRLNLAVEKTAWGIFSTEFYPSYEFKNIAASIKAEKLAADE